MFNSSFFRIGNINTVSCCLIDDTDIVPSPQMFQKHNPYQYVLQYDIQQQLMASLVFLCLIQPECVVPEPRLVPGTSRDHDVLHVVNILLDAV